MPVIKSAIKKLRKDRKREVRNDEFRKNLKDTIKHAKRKGTSKSVKDAFSIIDKASKKNLLHKNKAARIKSSLSKKAPQKKTASK